MSVFDARQQRGDGCDAQQNLSVSWQANAAMMLLGLAGPVGGLIMGYGMARGLSRSIYRLKRPRQGLGAASRP